jgi:hypothetical protein
VTFTATVSSLTAGTITGAFTFFDGATQIGSPATVSGGSAAISISTLTQGNHSITAQYSGDANYAASTSGTVTQVVNAASASDFTFTAGAPSTSVSAPGASSAPVILTITGKNGYNGTVAFSPASCSILPAGSESTCSFSPGTVTGSGTTQVTIVTSAPQASLLAPQHGPFSADWWMARGATTLILTILLAYFAKPRRSSTVLALLVFSFVTTFVGCGGGSAGGGGGTTNSGTPTGLVYTVTVTATANGGQPSHTASFTFSVQ